MKKITFLLASIGFLSFANAQEANPTEQPVETKKAADKTAPVRKTVEKPATHKDGILAYFKKEFVYPPRTNFVGNVVINYIAEFDGTLSDIKVVTPCPDKIKEEVLRVFTKSSGDWTPAQHEGQMVRHLGSTQVKITTP